ncbi:unnamed protein product [Cochlearia groenlandica]
MSSNLHWQKKGGKLANDEVMAMQKRLDSHAIDKDNADFEKLPEIVRCEAKAVKTGNDTSNGISQGEIQTYGQPVSGHILVSLSHITRTTRISGQTLY